MVPAGGDAEYVVSLLYINELIAEIIKRLACHLANVKTGSLAWDIPLFKRNDRDSKRLEDPAKFSGVFLSPIPFFLFK